MENKNKLKEDLTFMTWNLYLGADLSPFLTATANEIPLKLKGIFLQFLATNFKFRASAIARQIAAKKPDIIGLQEVEWIQLGVPNMPIVTYDYLELLLKELNKLGLTYDLAVQNDNISVQLPLQQNGMVKILDRDVILMRRHPTLTTIRYQSASFNTNFSLPLGDHFIDIIRGWSFIDVQSTSGKFRVINTHLEPYSSIVQMEQAKEILEGPANTKLPLILLGDLNSNADGSSTPTYRNIINQGFKDVWSKVGQGSGYTCCQSPDLMNLKSSLSKRIDYILFKNGWKPISADVVGDKQHDKTITGLWPSDHAGVLASLFLK